MRLSLSLKCVSQINFDMNPQSLSNSQIHSNPLSRISHSSKVVNVVQDNLQLDTSILRISRVMSVDINLKNLEDSYSGVKEALPNLNSPTDELPSNFNLNSSSILYSTISIKDYNSQNKFHTLEILDGGQPEYKEGYSISILINKEDSTFINLVNDYSILKVLIASSKSNRSKNARKSIILNIKL